MLPTMTMYLIVLQTAWLGYHSLFEIYLFPFINLMNKIALPGVQQIIFLHYTLWAAPLLGPKKNLDAAFEEDMELWLSFFQRVFLPNIMSYCFCMHFCIYSNTLMLNHPLEDNFKQQLYKYQKHANKYNSIHMARYCLATRNLKMP